MPERAPIGVCGKVAFRKRDAQTKRNLLQRNQRKHERHLSIYQCETCPGGVWHLTHATYHDGRRNWNR